MPGYQNYHQYPILGYQSPYSNPTTPGTNPNPSFQSQPNTVPGQFNYYNQFVPVYGYQPMYNNSPGNAAPANPPISTPKTNKNSSSLSTNYPIHQLSTLLNIPVNVYTVLVAIYNSIKAKKYVTSALSPVRNYLTVFEYSIHNNFIIWDYESGFVHLTGIWKAAEAAASFMNQQSPNNRAKADIVKLLDSTPQQYHPYIKRIRGGYLKIQGTWLPYSLCKILARRFCYYIRFELIPLFGNDFPNYCVLPTDPRFRELKFDEMEMVLDSNPDVLHASKCLSDLNGSDNRRVNQELIYLANQKYQSGINVVPRGVTGTVPGSVPTVNGTNVPTTNTPATNVPTTNAPPQINVHSTPSSSKLPPIVPAIGTFPGPSNDSKFTKRHVKSHSDGSYEGLMNPIQFKPIETPKMKLESSPRIKRSFSHRSIDEFPTSNDATSTDALTKHSPKSHNSPTTPNYSPSNESESNQSNDELSGINSILMAANLTKKPSPKLRRISIKINDLLS